MKVIIKVTLHITVAYLIIEAVEITRTVITVSIGVIQLLATILAEMAVDGGETTRYRITTPGAVILGIHPMVLTQL